jgi:hypothetical protein
VVGGTHFRNLFLNTGHGTLGWTMACGSGRYLADLMAGVMPHISSEGLDISRYNTARGASRSGEKYSSSMACPVTFELDKNISSSFRGGLRPHRRPNPEPSVFASIR